MNCNSALFTRSVPHFFKKGQKELETGKINVAFRILLRLMVIAILLNAGLLRAQNPIVSENALPGNPKSEWDINLAGDLSIQGFATDMSVNKGGTIRFKITVNGGVNYNIKIYRLGYYQGNGARLIADLGTFTGQQQPNPVSNTQTGLVDCGNWAESASWPVPSTAVSGVYLAKLTRADNNGSSHIVFVVRDDARNAGLLFKTSDATWQAYNVYGGNSFYTGSTSYPSGHAVKISYNRPFVTRGGGGGGDAMMDWLFNAEYPMIRWLERNGYDVAYTTDVDMDRDPAPITPSKHKALLSVGHDEYWSGAQRAKFEAARGAGVHLAFFSGNEVYWKTRWETSIDGNNTPHRTLVCYKEGDVGENVCGGKCDPLPNVWTGLWREGCSFSADGCQPENALTGQISWTESTGGIRVPDTFKSLPIWRNTSVASLSAGQSVTFPNGTLGYEWDAVEPAYESSNPPGRQILSRTTLDGKTHEMSLYQHSSGALVFGAGTVQWSWGLDPVHDRGNAAPSRDMQQATVNLISDMGVEPGSLQTDLVPGIPTNDTQSPISSITFPAEGSILTAESPYTLSGISSDSGGGIVAGVDVSTDGGINWQRALGTNNWTFSWTPTVTGPVVLKVRAVDNSGNIETPGTPPSANAINVTVNPGSGTYSIWNPTTVPVRVADPDQQPVEVGVKFKPLVNGFISGIRYYKSTTNTGPHIGNLWSGTGTNLARATFSDETASGWQEVLFSSPVPVSAGTTYLASYHTTTGQYSSDEFYFTNGVTTPFLQALQDGVEGGNGVYVYSSTTTFPTNGFNASNFWVDVVFRKSVAQDTIPPVVVSAKPANNATGIAPSAAVTATFSESINEVTLNTSTFELTGPGNSVVSATISYNSETRTATLTPTATLADSTTYTVLIRGGSADPRIKDATGNALRENYTWTFTTSKASAATGPFTIWSSTTIPVRVADPDQVPIEVGVKFRPVVDGYITGVRFYKSSTNTGIHIGNLWTSAGLNLARSTFTGETSSGWQEVLFDTPVSVAAGTTYVASYHTTVGQYASDESYFTNSITTPYLEALRDGQDGVNGLYRYSSTTAFPTNGYRSSNFWVDVVFMTSIGPDTIPPRVLTTSPINGAAGTGINTGISASFNEAIDQSSLTGSTFELRGPSNNLIPTTMTYSSATRTATLTPDVALDYSTSYTAKLFGGNPTGSIRDLAGNILTSNFQWTFSTTSPPPPPPVEGPGGPILVVSAASNPFSRYPVEILRAEGLNAFTAMDISAVTASELNKYDVVILGEVPLTAGQVSMFTDWTNSGGTFISFKPDTKLSSLLGLTRVTGNLSNRYLQVHTASGPGKGIVGQTIQFHGSADLYTLNGATSIASLYSNANTPTANPAVTSKNVGSQGGIAIAFTFDLARSIVYTRQGNPAWAGQERDGMSGPIRANDMFFGNAASDPQPDWIDFDKVDIPQADEQQRLLANLILQGNLDRKPLPRFWYLPKGLKATIVMTGDDHGNGGTVTRFNQYKNLSSSNTADAVANWTAIRGTSYIYAGTPITGTQLAQFQNDGFEVALHLNTGCTGYTESSLTTDWDDQSNQLKTTFPGLNPLVTNRTHCMPWSDWATHAKVQAAKGVRIDVNYYYWPGSWIQNRPGMFTGSGMPMRFADLDGSIIDCYQVPTQITDESDISSYTAFVNSLLDKAKGPEGYFGVFCANMHTDQGTSQGSDEIINSALARQIPVISAKQMLDWLDGRNSSSFGSINWNLNQLSFSITASTGSRNMKAMLPGTASTGNLTGITRNGAPVPFTLETIKGMEYALFDATSGDFVATYGIACLASNPTDTTVTAFGSAKFSVRTVGGIVNYQWQVSQDNGTTFTNISNNTTYSGATDSTLTISNVSRSFNNFRYRCIINGPCSATSTAATLVVNKANQIITWNNPQNITYGTGLTSQQLNASVTGPVGGSLPGTLTYIPAAGTILGAGNHTLNVNAAETNDYNPATTSVSLNVDQKVVTAQFSILGKVYDASNSATIGNRDLLGKLDNDVTLSGGTAAFSDRHAGNNKPVSITGFSLTGSTASNYFLSSENSSASGNISPLNISPAFTAANKAYSGTATANILTRTLPGAFEIDSVYLWGGTASFDNAQVGNNKTVTATGLKLGGAYPGNYQLASAVATTTASITPKAVSGTITVANKIYDGTTDATITSRKLNGLLSADVNKVSLNGGIANFNNMHVGSKRIMASGFTLIGSSAGNYTLSSSFISAMANILKRPVTVTARSGQSKIGGTADPVFLYDITSGSLVNGDAFSGVLSRMAGETAGSYPILQGTLSLSSNYDLTYSGANFIITAPIISNINNEKYPLKSQISPVLNVIQNIVLTGYPNPFSQKATIEFTVPGNEKQVFLDLFDLRGLKVTGLYKGPANANQLYSFTLDGTNIPPGAYFVRLTLPNQIENYKIIMLE